MNSIDRIFEKASRIVVKVGSSLIVDDENTVRDDWLRSLAKDIAELRSRSKQVVIVSSGAVGLGRGTLEYGTRKLDLTEKQAAAACGQIALISSWAKAFKFDDEASHYPAQILLTIDDSENRRRYLNARNTFRTLLAQSHIVPIVNENDTVATEELRVGDNDRLGSRVAQMVGADLLVILSDVDGLYSANPSSVPDAEFVPLVDRITPEIEAMAGGTGTSIASGGMRTKIDAAKIATANGCHTIIASGREDHPIRQMTDGGKCTLFISKADSRDARKQWISGSLREGVGFIADEGAKSALLTGKSLLPAGVLGIYGSFERGDTVGINDISGNTFAKGLAEYSSGDAERIVGAKSSEIERILGFKYRDSFVHCDNLVLESHGASYGS